MKAVARVSSQYSHREERVSSSSGRGPWVEIALSSAGGTQIMYAPVQLQSVHCQGRKDCKTTCVLTQQEGKRQVQSEGRWLIEMPGQAVSSLNCRYPPSLCPNSCRGLGLGILVSLRPIISGLVRTAPRCFPICQLHRQPACWPSASCCSHVLHAASQPEI